MAKLPLHAKTIAALQCPAGARKALYRDALCKGLALEVRSSGGKTWYLIYTNQRGKRRYHRLGDLLDLSLAQARTLADQCRNTIALGGDPAEEAAQLRQVPTFGTFTAEQYLPYVQTYKRSWAFDRSVLRNHLLPDLAHRPLDTITRADVLALQQQWIRSGFAPGTINKHLVLLRYIYNLAIKWQIPGVTSNPTSGIALLTLNNQRQRFLSPQEAKRLLEAVRSSDNTVLEPIIQMLLLTGARKREVLDARWQDIDWQRCLWRIPTTKAGKARYVPLSAAAITLLEERKQPSGRSGWIFPNPKTQQPFRSIYIAWNTARIKAGLAEVRIHDLRHSFASFLINGGRSLYEVQQLLGHSNSAMTQRYAHLAHETLLDATGAAALALEAVEHQQAPEG